MPFTSKGTNPKYLYRRKYALHVLVTCSCLEGAQATSNKRRVQIQTSLEFADIRFILSLSLPGMWGRWPRRCKWGSDIGDESLFCFLFFHGKIYSLQNDFSSTNKWKRLLFHNNADMWSTWTVLMCSRQWESEHKSSGSWVWIATALRFRLHISEQIA